MKRYAMLLALCLLPQLSATDAQAPKVVDVKHPRGRKIVPPHVIKQRVDFTHAQHKPSLTWMHKFIPASYDCRTQGFAPSIDDQGQCGNCYEHSGVEVCAGAQLIAGQAKFPFALSAQYVLDNYPGLGGCGGGDEWAVAQQILSSGCPNTTQYIGPGQSPGVPQNTSSMTMYKIVSMGYCTPSTAGNGPATAADVQASILKYGPVSVAVAASTPQWDSYQAGQVITDQSNDIDHAVLCIGWKMQGTTIIWLGQNSWGTSWGDNGTFWIQDGACSFNTEAFYVTATPILPPAPPTPTPPGPTPTPPPPLPGTTPTITLAGTGVYDGTKELSPVGQAALIQQFVTGFQQLQPAPSPTPGSTLEARVAAIEATLKDIALTLNSLKKEIGK